MSIYPERLVNIAHKREVTIISIDKLFKKVEIQCNECKAISNPAIEEMTKSRFLKTKCKCQTWKIKTQEKYENTRDWKVIAKIEHPMAAKYRLIHLHFQIFESLHR